MKSKEKVTVQSTNGSIRRGAITAKNSSGIKTEAAIESPCIVVTAKTENQMALKPYLDMTAKTVDIVMLSH